MRFRPVFWLAVILIRAFPCELHRTVAFFRSCQAYSSGGCNGMAVEGIDRVTVFPFHLPHGRGARHLKLWKIIGF